jgi:hypothetical protein
MMKRRRINQQQMGKIKIRPVSRREMEGNSPTSIKFRLKI